MLPLIGWGAVAAGAGTLGAAKALPDLFFGTVKKQAEDEISSYDPTTGTRERGLDDIIGEFFTDRQAKTDKAVKDLYVKNLDDTYGVNIGKIKRSLRNDGLDLSELNINEKTNAKKLKQLIAELDEKVGYRAKQLDRANALGYLDEAAALPTNQITAMLRGKKEEKDEKLKTEKETALQEKRTYERGVVREANEAARRLQADKLLISESVV